jgi:hypothetical protein
MTQSSSATWVWLARDGSDVRMMHDFIVVRGPSGPRVFECTTGGAGRAVSGVLAAAGFAGGASAGVEVTMTDVEDRGLVLLRGFAVEDGDAADLEMEIRSALAGELGGFLPVLASVSTFHSPAHLAFEYVWASAGKPPITIRQPSLTGGPGRGATPTSPLQAAWGELRYALSCQASGEEPPSGGSGQASA